MSKPPDPVEIRPPFDPWASPVRVSEPRLCWARVERRHLVLVSEFGSFLTAYCHHHGFAA